MGAPVTGFYAALLAFLILALGLRVIAQRWRTRTGIGDGGDRGLARAIRVHGNAVEYVPLALVLMLVAEIGHASPALLHGCGIALCAARVLHALGLSRRSGATAERMIGTVGTFGVIAVLAWVDLAAFLR
jgi:hypothetical protein